MNLTVGLLWHEELKNIYRTRLPRIPDRYIDRLESDKWVIIFISADSFNKCLTIYILF